MFEVALVGLGNIGQLYDYDIESGDIVFSHAKALKEFSGFEFVCGVETDAALRQKFEAKYKLPTYTTIDDMAKKHTPSIFIIATSTNTHYEIFNKIASYNPAAILCEKPLASTLEDAREMVDVCGKKNITLVINFKRRFDPAVQNIKNLIEKKEFGKIEKVVCFYGKGILNNGSHVIDLLIFFFGKPISCQVLTVNNYNSYVNDYDADIKISFDGFDAYLMANNHTSYTLFEMNIIGSENRVKYEAKNEEVVEIFSKKQHNLFKGYFFLDENPKLIKTDMNRYQLNTIKHLYDVVVNGAKSLSDGENALVSLELVDTIINQISKTGELS